MTIPNKTVITLSSIIVLTVMGSMFVKTNQYQKEPFPLGIQNLMQQRLKVLFLHMVILKFMQQKVKQIWTIFLWS